MEPACQGKTMAEYKLYILGETGMIARGIWLDCADDEEALEQARERAVDDTRELWAGERLVRAFMARRRPAQKTAA